MDRGAVEQDAPQEGGSPAEPVSGENTGTAQPTGMPGNRCPSVIQCHKPKSLRVCRPLPECPLLHSLTAAALLVRSECAQRRQERLSEDDCHLWLWRFFPSGCPRDAGNPLWRPWDGHLPPHPVHRNSRTLPFWEWGPL